jgi:hypothetical protein
MNTLIQVMKKQTTTLLNCNLTHLVEGMLQSRVEELERAASEVLVGTEWTSVVLLFQRIIEHADETLTTGIDTLAVSPCVIVKTLRVSARICPFFVRID